MKLDKWASLLMRNEKNKWKFLDQCLINFSTWKKVNERRKKKYSFAMLYNISFLKILSTHKFTTKKKYMLSLLKHFKIIIIKKTNLLVSITYNNNDWSIKFSRIE